LILGTIPKVKKDPPRGNSPQGEGVLWGKNAEDDHRKVRKNTLKIPKTDQL